MRHNHLAGIRFQESHDVAERNRLADAAASDDGEGFSAVEEKIDVGQNGLGERLVYVAEFDVVWELVGHVDFSESRVFQSSGEFTLQKAAGDNISMRLIRRPSMAAIILNVPAASAASTAGSARR